MDRKTRSSPDGRDNRRRTGIEARMAHRCRHIAKEIKRRAEAAYLRSLEGES